LTRGDQREDKTVNGYTCPTLPGVAIFPLRCDQGELWAVLHTVTGIAFCNACSREEASIIAMVLSLLGGVAKLDAAGVEANRKLLSALVKEAIHQYHANIEGLAHPERRLSLN